MEEVFAPVVLETSISALFLVFCRPARASSQYLTDALSEPSGPRAALSQIPLDCSDPWNQTVSWCLAPYEAPQFPERDPYARCSVPSLEDRTRQSEVLITNVRREI